MATFAGKGEYDMIEDILVGLFFMVLVVAPIFIVCLMLQNIMKDGDDDV